MNAMILAAGRGTRLRRVSGDVPKVLVDIGGEPLLSRQLRYLAGEGFGRVVVNTHHLAEQVRDFAASYRGPVELILSHEPALLGTAGAVRHALDLLGGDPFLVLYGDVVIDEPLAPLLEAHRRSKPAATLAVYASTELEGKGTIEAGEDGLVRGFREKAPAAAGTALVNAGVYLLEPTFVDELPAGVELDFGHDVFPQALASGQRLLAHRLARKVVDIGTPAELARARRLG